MVSVLYIIEFYVGLHEYHDDIFTLIKTMSTEQNIFKLICSVTLQGKKRKPVKAYKTDMNMTFSGRGEGVVRHFFKKKLDNKKKKKKKPPEKKHFSPDLDALFITPFPPPPPPPPPPLPHLLPSLHPFASVILVKNIKMPCCLPSHRRTHRN